MVHPSDGGGWLILVVAVLVEDLMMKTGCHQDESDVAFAMLCLCMWSLYRSGHM